LTMMDLYRTHKVGFLDAFWKILSPYLLPKYEPHFQCKILHVIITHLKKNIISSLIP
jgi:hypothetical protein